MSLKVCGFHFMKFHGFRRTHGTFWNETPVHSAVIAITLALNPQNTLLGNLLNLFKKNPFQTLSFTEGDRVVFFFTLFW